MRSRSTRAALAAVGAAAATVTGLVVVPQAASASSLSQVPYVSVVTGRVGIYLPTSLPAGRTTFRITTNDPTGNGATFFRLNAGHTLSDVVQGLHDEFAGQDNPSGPPDLQLAAKGTRELEAAATFFGGTAGVAAGQAVRTTFTLYPGTYYVFSDDAMALPDAVKRIKKVTVHGSVPYSPWPATDGVVRAADEDHFQAPNTLPHDGTILWQNASTKDAHFMELDPVQPTATDTQVQDTFDKWMKGGFSDPGPFLDEPGVAAGVLSPGMQNLFTYHVKPGRYVIVCWVADVDNGVPHAMMGMHKIVDLK